MISELKSCHESYFQCGFIMTLLAAKSHLCINGNALEESKVNGIVDRAKLDEMCHSGVAERIPHRMCPYYPFREFKMSAQPYVEAKVWDIEDAHHLGRGAGCCPHFIATSLVESADIIFAPYIYLIDPLIRESSKISLENAIIVIDEAHNIEDTCREAASFEVKFHISFLCLISLFIFLLFIFDIY